MNVASVLSIGLPVENTQMAIDVRMIGPLSFDCKFNTSAMHLEGQPATSSPITEPTNDERMLALLAHVLTFVSSFIIPLVIYLVKKDESRFVAEHAKESLNFQITLAILFAISFILIILVIGIFMMWALGIAAFVLVIVATIKASEGKMYRYPFTLRLIK